MNTILPTFDKFVLELILAHLDNCKKDGLILKEMPPHLIILKHENGHTSSIVAHDKMQFIEEKRPALWHYHCNHAMEKIEDSMGYINFFVCDYEENSYIGIYYNLKDLDLDCSNQCMIIPLMEDNSLDVKLSFIEPIELGLMVQEDSIVYH